MFLDDNWFCAVSETNDINLVNMHSPDFEVSKWQFAYGPLQSLNHCIVESPPFSAPLLAAYSKYYALHYGRSNDSKGVIMLPSSHFNPSIIYGQSSDRVVVTGGTSFDLSPLWLAFLTLAV